LWASFWPQPNENRGRWKMFVDAFEKETLEMDVSFFKNAADDASEVPKPDD